MSQPLFDPLKQGEAKNNEFNKGVVGIQVSAPLNELMNSGFVHVVPRWLDCWGQTEAMK